MIETSQELIDSMRGVQTASARISILNSTEVTTYGYTYQDVMDYLIDAGYVKDSESEGNKKIDQLCNGLIYETGKYAIFEGEGLELSGVQVVSKEAKNNQFGWYGKYLCDANGVCEAEATLSWHFGKEICDSDKFNIVFSKQRNEYAVDFTVRFSMTAEDPVEEDIITEIHVTGNDKTECQVDAPACYNYMGGSVMIIIEKWNTPNARAKITQLYFGDMIVYSDDNIVSFKTTKELDLLNESTPSKQIEIVLQDEEENYNIFKPAGKLSNLNSNSKIILEQGATINDFIYYIKTDEYIVTNPTKENPLEIKITGIGRMSSNSNYNFTYNLYEKSGVADLLEAPGERDEHFIVDNKIKEEKELIRTQYKECSLIEGIRKMATAVRANIMETIDNDILLKRIDFKVPVSYIALENMIETPKIEKLEKANSIEIKTYTPRITKTNQELVNSKQFRTKKGERYYFDYNVEHTAPAYKAELELRDWPIFDQNGNYIRDETVREDVSNNVAFLDNFAIFYGYIDNYEYYKDCDLYIYGNVVETVCESLKYVLDEKASNNLSIDNESVETKKQALKIYSWIAENYNKQFKILTEIQDTFTYELGDTVLLETNVYVNNQMIVKEAIITKIEQEYDGTLKYSIETRSK